LCFERIDNKAKAKKTPIGFVPTEESLDLTGIDIDENTLKELFYIDAGEYLHETNELEKYFFLFGEKLPQGIRDELDAMKNRLQRTLENK